MLDSSCFFVARPYPDVSYMTILQWYIARTNKGWLDICQVDDFGIGLQ
jgi:hypothetical protein